MMGAARLAMAKEPNSTHFGGSFSDISVVVVFSGGIFFSDFVHFFVGNVWFLDVFGLGVRSQRQPGEPNQPPEMPKFL